mgnify:CR=1 FL=1
MKVDVVSMIVDVISVFSEKVEGSLENLLIIQPHSGSLFCGVGKAGLNGFQYGGHDVGLSILPFFHPMDGLSIFQDGLTVLLDPYGVPLYPRGVPLYPCGVPLYPCGVPLYPCGVPLDP